MKFYLRFLKLLSYIQLLPFKLLADSQNLDPPAIRGSCEQSTKFFEFAHERVQLVKDTALRQFSCEVHFHDSRVAKRLCNSFNRTLEGHPFCLATSSFTAITSFTFPAINSLSNSSQAEEWETLDSVLAFCKAREWENFLIFGKRDLDGSETCSSLQTLPYKLKCPLAVT